MVVILVNTINYVHKDKHNKLTILEIKDIGNCINN